MTGKPRGRKGGRKALPPGLKKQVASVRLSPENIVRLKEKGAKELAKWLETK